MIPDIFIISLPSALHRKDFQQKQASRIGINPIYRPALDAKDMSDAVFIENAFNWQRPLLKTEVACFLSHLQIWLDISKSNKPAVILEDDAILGKDWLTDVCQLTKYQGADYICLETWGPKLLSKTKQFQPLKLRKLTLNSAGAAGYILWPSGAQLLVSKYYQSGAALADAFMNQIVQWRAWQLVPANVVQMNRASAFGLDQPPECASLIARGMNQSPKPLNFLILLKLKIRRLAGEIIKGWIKVSNTFNSTRVLVPFNAPND